MLAYSAKPSGGYAVVYEYANQLVARGHEVIIVHARRFLRGNTHPLNKVHLWLTGKARKPRTLIQRPEVHWYPIDSRVKMLYVPELTASYIPDGDAIFGYGMLMAGEDYPPEKGMEFLLLQHYAVFPEAVLYALWRAPVGKIVIARWLYEQGLKLGVPADEMIHIPNGIDHSKYRILLPIENRPPKVAMLYSQIPWKGSENGIKALELARRQFPTIQAVLFGVYPRPKTLPGWIEYHCDPPQEELVGSIYNGSSIYLCPSWTEGFGLPPAEAMACGCAVVSTDNGGVRDYAEHGVTALLSPPKDPEALAANLLRLLEDDELRMRLAVAGHEHIQEFTWERSTDLLEQFLIDRIERSGTQEKA